MLFSNLYHYENINYNKAFDLKFIDGVNLIMERISEYN